jgi:gamma-glutamylcyclotransferase (GGCT)/AIG2-like uncharacterized protein YtfP
MEKVFIYGTLRPGFKNHHKLREARVIERKKRVAGYKMFNCGDYPIVQPSSQGFSTVEGDIISIPESRLEELDRFEGVPEGEFQRIRDKTHGFWIYVSGPNPPRTLNPMESGVWVE